MSIIAIGTLLLGPCQWLILLSAAYPPLPLLIETCSAIAVFPVRLLSLQRVSCYGPGCWSIISGGQASYDRVSSPP